MPPTVPSLQKPQAAVPPDPRIRLLLLGGIWEECPIGLFQTHRLPLSQTEALFQGNVADKFDCIALALSATHNFSFIQRLRDNLPQVCLVVILGPMEGTHCRDTLVQLGVDRCLGCLDPTTFGLHVQMATWAKADRLIPTTRPQIRRSNLNALGAQIAYLKGHIPATTSSGTGLFMAATDSVLNSSDIIQAEQVLQMFDKIEARIVLEQQAQAQSRPASQGHRTRDLQDQPDDVIALDCSTDLELNPGALGAHEESNIIVDEILPAMLQEESIESILAWCSNEGSDCALVPQQ